MNRCTYQLLQENNYNVLLPFHTLLLQRFLRAACRIAEEDGWKILISVIAIFAFFALVCTLCSALLESFEEKEQQPQPQPQPQPKPNPQYDEEDFV